MNKIINSSALKMIAIFSMLSDHIGMTFFPDLLGFRLVGRLAFPIFSYCLVEGYYHTRDVKRYMIRLFLFALLSEIPYDLLHSNSIFNLNEQNIFFTLFIGLFLIYAWDITKDLYLRFLYLVIALIWSYFLKAEYVIFGIVVILCFYLFRNRFNLICISQILISVAYVISTPGNNMKYLQLAGPLALIFIYLYNGEKGLRIKYFFYIFYPVHFLIMYLIRLYVNGGV